MEILAAVLFTAKLFTASPAPAPAQVRNPNQPRRARDLNRTRPRGFRVPSNAEKWSR